MEVMRNFLYEMVLSNNRATVNDFNAAVDDVRVQVIQAAACLLTNEVGLTPVSNRVVTESEVGLLTVVIQHV